MICEHVVTGDTVTAEVVTEDSEVFVTAGTVEVVAGSVIITYEDGTSAVCHSSYFEKTYKEVV